MSITDRARSVTFKCPLISTFNFTSYALVMFKMFHQMVRKIMNKQVVVRLLLTVKCCLYIWHYVVPHPCNVYCPLPTERPVPPPPNVCQVSIVFSPQWIDLLLLHASDQHLICPVFTDRLRPVHYTHPRPGSAAPAPRPVHASRPR